MSQDTKRPLHPVFKSLAQQSVVLRVDAKSTVDIAIDLLEKRHPEDIEFVILKLKQLAAKIEATQWEQA